MPFTYNGVGTRYNGKKNVEIRPGDAWGRGGPATKALAPDTVFLYSSLNQNCIYKQYFMAARCKRRRPEAQGASRVRPAPCSSSLTRGSHA